MDPIQKFITALPQLDPTFFSVRKAVYDKSENPWIKLGLLDSYWVRSTSKLGPFKTRVLSSAFGWEMPPWTKRPPQNEADYKDFVSSVCSLKNWDMIQINVVSDEQAANLTSEFEKIGAKVNSYPYRTYVIHGFDSYEKLVASRSQNARKKLRYNTNTLNRGGFTVRRDDLEWDAIIKVLDERKADFANGADYTQTDDFRKFFKSFRERMKAEQRLHEIGVYDAQNSLVAYTLGFEFNGVLRDYQGAFMKNYTDYSLGFMCIEGFIQKALNSGRDFIDYMGDASYLSSHTTQSLELKRLVVFAPHLRAKLLGWITSLRK